MTINNGLTVKQIVEAFGGLEAFRKAIKVSESEIRQWIRTGVIPDDRQDDLKQAMKVAKISNLGALKDNKKGTSSTTSTAPSFAPSASEKEKPEKEKIESLNVSEGKDKVLKDASSKQGLPNHPQPQKGSKGFGFFWFLLVLILLILAPYWQGALKGVYHKIEGQFPILASLRQGTPNNTGAQSMTGKQENPGVQLQDVNNKIKNINGRLTQVTKKVATIEDIQKGLKIGLKNIQVKNDGRGASIKGDIKATAGHAPKAAQEGPVTPGAQVDGAPTPALASGTGTSTVVGADNPTLIEARQLVSELQSLRDSLKTKLQSEGQNVQASSMQSNIDGLDTKITQLNTQLSSIQKGQQEGVQRLNILEKDLPEMIQNGQSIDKNQLGFILGADLLQEAVRTGVPYQNLLTKLKQTAVKDADIQSSLTALDADAQKGVPSKLALIQSFKALMKDIEKEIQKPSATGWFDKTLNNLGNIVTVRDENSLTSKILTALKTGEYAKAKSLIEGLKTVPNTLQKWTVLLDKRLVAEKAILVLRQKALGLLLAQPKE